MATQISGSGGKEKQVIVNLLVKTQVDQARQDIEKLNATLQSISNKKVTINSSSLSQAVNAASQLQMHLQNAINVDTNKLDLSKLNNSLKSAGTNLSSLTSQLRGAGADGQKAFTQIARTIASAEVPIARMGGVIKSFGVTLFNTVKWQVSSKLIHGITGSISGAFQHAKNLNSALNSIQIVTGSSAEHMANFANKAREAATALNSTTTEYTKASLIFFQQGLDEKAAMARTNTVIKLSQVTRQSVEDIASQMTAIWNNFEDGTKSLEHYADVITALGASTASSSAEIAQGMQKFAAVAETVGLSYEKAASALATVVANTRLSAEVVGTAFKTILARVDSLKLGDTLDDDVTLNKYAAALQTIGVNVLDSNNNLRKMDNILDELGEKWNLISEAQKTAIATVVAGQRQYAQFMALMNNYDELLANQQTAENSEGTLAKQAEIWSSSWEAASKRVEQSQKNLYDSMINSDFMIKMNDMFGSLINSASSFVKACGGIGPVLLMIGGLFSQTLFPLISTGIQKLQNNISVWTGQAANEFALMQGSLVGELEKTLGASSRLTEGEKREVELTQQLITKKAELMLASTHMTEAEKMEAEVKMAVFEANQNIIRSALDQQIAAEKELRTTEQQIKANNDLRESIQKAAFAYQEYQIARDNSNNKSNNSYFGQNVFQKANALSEEEIIKNRDSEAQLAREKMANMSPESRGVATLFLLKRQSTAALEEKSILENKQQNGIATPEEINRITVLRDRLKDIVSQEQQIYNTYDNLKTKLPWSKTSAGQMDNYLHGLQDYQKGLSHNIQHIEEYNRLLQVKNNLESKFPAQRPNMNKQDIDAMNIGRIRVDNFSSRNETQNILAQREYQNIGFQARQTQQGVDVGYLDATKENYETLINTSERLKMKNEELEASIKEIGPSLQEAGKFSLDQVKTDRLAIKTQQDLIKEIDKRIGSLRADVVTQKNNIANNKKDKQAKDALKQAESSLTDELKLKEQEINKLNKMEQEYVTNTTDAQNAVADFSTKINAIGKEIGLSDQQLAEFNQLLSDITNSGNPTEQQIEELIGKVRQFASASTETSEELDILAQAILEAFQKSNVSGLEGLEEKLRNVVRTTEDATTTNEKFTDTLGKNQRQAQKTVNIMSDITRTLSSMYMGYNALKSVVNVWTDENTSTLDKAMSTMMSLSMLIPAITAMYKLLNGEILKHIAAKAAETKATWASAAANAANWAAAHPLLAGVVTGAMVVAAGAAVALSKANEKSNESFKKSVETQQEMGKATGESAKKVIEESTAIDELVQSYKKLKEAGENYRSVQQDIINKIPDMIASFEDMAEKIELSGDKLEKFNKLVVQLKLAAAANDIKEVERLKSEIGETLINEGRPIVEKSAAVAASELSAAGRKKGGAQSSDNTLTLHTGDSWGTADAHNKHFREIVMKTLDSRYYDIDSGGRTATFKLDTSSAEALKESYEAMLELQKAIASEMTPKEQHDADNIREINEFLNATKDQYQALVEAVGAESQLEAWGILNARQEELTNISSYADYDDFHDKIQEDIEKVAKEKGLDAEELGKAVDEQLENNAGLKDFKTISNGFDQLKNNLGEEVANEIKKEYNEATDDTKRAFEHAAPNFTNIFSKEALDRLIEFQEDLDIETAAKTAAEGLDLVKEKLKETGMSAKDWEDVQAELNKLNIDIDLNAFKNLAYQEQKNIIDTAKRTNILTGLNKNAELIKQAQDNILYWNSQNYFNTDWVSKEAAKRDLVNPNSPYYSTSSWQYDPNRDILKEQFDDSKESYDPYGLLKTVAFTEGYGSEVLADLLSHNYDELSDKAKKLVDAAQAEIQEVKNSQVAHMPLDIHATNPHFGSTNNSNEYEIDETKIGKDVDFGKPGIGAKRHPNEKRLDTALGVGLYLTRQAANEQLDKDAINWIKKAYPELTLPEGSEEPKTYDEWITATVEPKNQALTNNRRQAEENLQQQLQDRQEFITQWGQLIREATSLQELNTLTNEGNKIFTDIGFDIDFSQLGDYSQALIAMAANYDNAADEVEKYTQALFSNNKEVKQAAEESLTLSIRVGELSELYGINAEETEMQARMLQASGKYADVTTAQFAEMAVRNQRLNKGVEDLNQNFNDWAKTLTTSNKYSTEYTKALTNMTKALANLTGAADEADIPLDFLDKDAKNGQHHLALMQKAAQGDAQAIALLGNELAEAQIQMLSFFDDVAANDGFAVIDHEEFNSTKQTILDGIATIRNNLEELENGANLADIFEDETGLDNWIESLNTMAEATHMSVEQMNGFLNELGVSIPVETEYVDMTREMPEYASVHEVVENSTPPGYEGHGGTISTIYDTELPTGGTTTVHESVPIAKIGKNAKVHATYSGTKPSGGVSASSTSGKSGGSSSTPKREAGKNASDESERYHVINKETEQLTKAYDRLNTAKDRAFGANRLKLMDAEIANTKKQIALNKEYIKEAQAYAQQDYNNLINGKQNAYTIDGQWYSSEGLHGLGVELQLDENGVIQNYDEIMAAATAKYNERIAAYNANPENSNLKEIAEGEFNAIKELISQYEETNGLVQDKLDENQKLINQLQDQNLEKFNYKLELKFKISEREKKRIEFELREIGDDAFKSAEALSKMFSTDGSPSQWSIALDDLKTYEKSFDELNKLYAKGEISEAGYIEGLEKISDGIYEQLETILDLKDTMEDYYANTLSKLKEKYDELYASMTHGNEVLEHMKTLLGLIGKSTDYDSIGKLLEGQAEISKNAYDVSKADYEKNKRLREQREKELEEAEKRGGEEQIKIAKENLKAAQEAEQASQLQMLTDLENYITKRQEIINNNIEKSYAESEKILSNGMGFDYLNQSMELAAAGAERFYTKTNQLYETDKMRRQLQQDIDKTTNAAAKQRLASFEKEIQLMQDKEKLSKVELSLAQARYELLLAQIALEEAQNAKTTVRLQRDAEGNYGYVYTADQSKIAEAEQNVADKQNNLYNVAREAEQDSLQESVKLRQDMNEALKAIDQDEYLSWEEKEEKKNAITAYYLQQIEDVNNDHSLALGVLNETSATHMNDTWTDNFKEVMTNQTGMVNSFISEQDRLDEYLYGKDGQGGAFKDLADAARDVLGVELSNLGTIISNNTTESKKFKEELVGKDGKGGLVKATEEEANAVAKTTIEFGKAYDKADAYFKKLKKINEQIDELIEKATKDITIKTTYEETKNVKYNFTYTHTGNPPPEYKDGDYTVNINDPGKEEIDTDDEDLNIEKLGRQNMRTFWNGTKDVSYFYNSRKKGYALVSDVYAKGTNKGEYVEIADVDFDKLTIYKEWDSKTKKMIKFDTGGYTGRWYHSSDDPMMSGKLAMLHEKELVLNQEDTKNFLASIEMVRDLARMIDLQAASVGLRQQLEARFGLEAAQSELAQNIVINADFPNATDHNEIMEALETLADRAAQYANRTNRLIDSIQQRR